MYFSKLGILGPQELLLAMAVVSFDLVFHYLYLVKKDILTNGHFFKTTLPQLHKDVPIGKEEFQSLVVDCHFSERQNAKRQCIKLVVVYISHTHLDVALLRAKDASDLEIFNQHLVPVDKSSLVEIAIGMPVWVLAHGFSPEKGILHSL